VIEFNVVNKIADYAHFRKPLPFLARPRLGLSSLELAICDINIAFRLLNATLPSSSFSLFNIYIYNALISTHYI
jgi:hypothetical protein